ncbi:DgyrCDS9558 [Dimorphilus gyrociliatus]|uniref:Direct IAP-binding protein with low pI n=1 Tax=Dimorphilus gyrociliatus TaxID=2664684 RepID=A0A7I8W2M8_9ANNE|nr:DgyrCDS9558 [Dimorphilus gyrociliatus]
MLGKLPGTFMLRSFKSLYVPHFLRFRRGSFRVRRAMSSSGATGVGAGVGAGMAYVSEAEDSLSNLRQQLEQDLTPHELLKNSATNATLAAINMFSQSGLVYISSLREYVDILETLIRTLNIREKTNYIEDEDVVWQTIIGLRNTIQIKREAVIKNGTNYQACYNSLNSVAQTSFEIGSQDTPIFANERIQVISSKVDSLRDLAQSLEDEIRDFDINSVKSEN